MGGKVDLVKRIALGVFVPSNFSDREWLFELLDKRLDEIAFIATTLVGDNLVFEWAKSRSRPCLVYPINRGYNLMEAFSNIVKIVDKICIINNGCSESAVKIEDWCKEKGIDYKMVHCENILEKLNCANLKIAELENKLQEKKNRKNKKEIKGDA